MNIKQFIIGMFSSTNAVSSKRVGGLISIIVYIVFIILNFFIPLSETQIRMLESLLFVGGGLLGLGLLDKVKLINNKNDNESK